MKKLLFFLCSKYAVIYAIGGPINNDIAFFIDGHHQKSVAQHPEKMTDPRTIEFMEHSNHIKYHQKYGY